MSRQLERVMPNGLKIPVIGLGTWQASDESELEGALDVALECGYRHIDTAAVYHNEEIIGRVLKKWFDSGKLKREDIFITTKLPVAGVHEDRVDMFMDLSLKNLNLDYVDLYLIHFPIGSNYIEGHVRTPLDQLRAEKTDHLKIWKKMEEQVDAGKTKSIGISNFNQRQIENIWNNCRIKPACLQVEIHLFLQQEELVDYCTKKKIAVVAYSPLASPAHNKFLKKMGAEEKPALPNIFTNETVKEIAAKHGKSTGQIALRYLHERGVIPIPKSVNSSRIRENIDIFNFHLDDDDRKKLRKINVGEAARICDFQIYPKFDEHPEWPFPR